ncbi:MAG: kinase [Actinomycetota bacterium]|nr:kinase [Actinomycetota bacterium]
MSGRIGFVVHERRPAAVAEAAALQAELVADGLTATRLPGDEDGTRVAAGAFDLVVSIGGDGTFLRAAHVAAAAACPVLGVKVGRLGFLTEVEPSEARTIIEGALAGRSRIEERLAVTAGPAEGNAFEAQWALNEIMVEKRARHRLIRLDVRVDGDYVTTFSADGVIAATPTGRTAYSFSARGPIVNPSVRCLVLTPVAAHMVFDRSFVLGADQVVTIEVVGEEPGLLSADGRESIELPVGSRLTIKVADQPSLFVRRDPAPKFLTRVREKFDLPGRNDVGGEG